MRHRRRAGSALIFSLALAALAVLIGFGFLRTTLGNTIAGDRSQRVLLAQAAAQAGLEEATEAVIADYAATTLTVGSGNAGSTTIGNPPTFLDGPYRAPFVSASSPNRLKDVDRNLPAEDNDVRAWNMVVNPLIRQNNNDYRGVTQSRYQWYVNGLVYYDGRGRWIEPNFRNQARPSPAAAAPVPVDETRVLDLGTGPFASPDRHNGLFLDSALRRIESDGTLAGDQAARAAARYRLRYAIGVIDLGGHLLSNPKADLNLDWQDPNNEYRRPPDWVANAAEAWFNMTVLFPAYEPYPGAAPSTSLRWHHVFLGRGNASNYDRQPGTSKPVTFPLMFRQQKGQILDYSVNGSTPSGVPCNFWGMFNAKIGTGGSETTKLYNGTVTGKSGGNEVLAPFSSYMYSHTLCYALLGPQQSWFNQHQAVQGSLQNGYSVSNNRDGAQFNGEQAPLLDTAMLLPTPFGRGVRPWSGSGTRKWYEGHTSTPWLVNLLTAPPRVVYSMLAAYLPPSFKQVEAEESFAPKPVAPSWTTNWITPGNPCSATPVRGHDLFTEQAGPAFSEWPAPTDLDVDGVAYRNFLIPEPRQPEKIYPGRMWNEANLDNLGKDIDVDTVQTKAYCSHMGAAFLNPFWEFSVTGAKWSGGYVTTPPAGWGADGGDVWKRVPSAAAAQSYWIDLARAFASAVAVTRAAWVQYPGPATATPYINPSTAFTAPLVRDPALYDSIEKFDRLFLRQLGEDFDHPGSGTRLQPVVCSGATNQVYSLGAQVSNTIKTLLDADLLKAGAYTSGERAKVMERVLNDFRMSFLGASPQYYDRFRPLDFDGDGKVMCSCYAPNPAATADEKDKGIDRYAALDPAFGPGQGAAPDPDKWFSLSGTFYIGKSHYFRLICRGELFDNVTMRPVNDATIESVLAVDPEGTDIRQSHYLFQRWHFDRSNAHLSQVDR